MKRNYFVPTAVDELLEALAADQVENGLTRIGSNQENKAAICVALVEEWIRLYGYVKVGAVGSGEVRVVGCKEHDEYDTRYSREDFWEKLLESRVVSANIPDDPIERLVFHFLEDWPNRLRRDFDNPKRRQSRSSS